MTPETPRRADTEAVVRPADFPEGRKRSIQLLRDTLSMLCHFIWYRETRPGEHLWSIPVDQQRDFDCILSDAIDELEHFRAAGGPSGWQPIETAPKDGTVVIGALIRDGRLWRIHDMKHDGLAFYTLNGGSLPQMTHWLPAPPASR